MTPQGKAIKEAYQWAAKSQWKGAPLEGEVEATVHFYFGTKRKADNDNFNKLWQDALNGIVYIDDHQIAIDHHYRHYDKSRPRIEVTISPVE